MPLGIFNNFISTISQNSLNTNNSINKAIDLVELGNRETNVQKNSLSILLRSDRISIGATHNQFIKTLNNLKIVDQSLISASSSLQNADSSEEVTDLNMQKLQAPALTAMAGQANIIPKELLLLLQKIKS